jgi:hypothetical protein
MIRTNDMIYFTNNKDMFTFYEQKQNVNISTNKFDLLRDREETIY